MGLQPKQRSVSTTRVGPRPVFLSSSLSFGERTFGIHVHFTRVDLQNSSTGFFCWVRQLNLAVETTRSKQSRIQHVRSIRRRDHLDVRVAREPIQLVEELQHGSLHFSVAGLLAAETLRTNSIQLSKASNKTVSKWHTMLPTSPSE